MKMIMIMIMIMIMKSNQIKMFFVVLRPKEINFKFAFGSCCYHVAAYSYRTDCVQCFTQQMTLFWRGE
jgi:hypothetical protein